MDILKTMGFDLAITGITDPGKNTVFSLIPQTHIIDNSKITKINVQFENKAETEAKITKSLLFFEISNPIKKVLYQKSAWCNENQTILHPVGKNIHLFSSGARTTQDFNPLIIINTEKSQFSFHVLPIGDWEISLTYTQSGFCRISMGLKSTGLLLKVSANSKIELPSVILQDSPGHNELSNAFAFHEYLNKYHFTNNRNIPVPYNSWFYDFDKFKETDLKTQAVRAMELGMDVFIVDAGWYGPSNEDWAKAAGDWREKTNGGFYGRMKQFSDYIISLGMRFGLWIEPERICSGVPALDEHPEYFIEAPNGCFYPDLSKPEPIHYIYKTIASLIDKYNVGWLKLDFNFSLGSDPGGSNFYQYTKGLYEIMEKLRTSYPDVIFEGCESGAMRFDLESARHYNVHFLSDNVNPTDALEIFKNSVIRMPPSVIYKWIAAREINGVPKYGIPMENAPGRLIVPKGATWDRFESADISFLCCLAISGHPGFSGDINSISTRNREIIKKYIEIYKENANFFNSCGSYVYSQEEMSPETGWTVYQLISSDSEKSLLFCFRLDSDSQKCSVKLIYADIHKIYKVENAMGGFSIIPGSELIEGFEANAVNKHTASLYIISPK